MSFENGTPERPHNRFEIPQHLVDDMDDIVAKVGTEVLLREIEKYDYDTDDKAHGKERAKVIELLKSLAEPSIDNPYVERKKAEYTVAVLRNMGLPVDCSFDLLRLGVPPEVIADKMLEERENESDPYQPEGEEA